MIKNSTVSVLNDAIKKIKEKNAELKAFIEIFEESALEQAKKIDEKRASGKPLGRLAGVCVGIQDNLMYKGHLMTCASKILQGQRAPFTATAVQRLIDEDAVIVGRLDMDELGAGPEVKTACADAVAAGMVPLALGTEAAGLKPTYGRISRYGLSAFSGSVDRIGIFANNAADAAIALGVLAGADDNDAMAYDIAVPDYTNALSTDLTGLKIGVLENCGYGESLETLKKLGAQIINVSLPSLQYGEACYRVLTSAEASANFEKFDGIRFGFAAEAENLDEVYSKTRAEGFGKEVKKTIISGHYILSKDNYKKTFVKAQAARAVIAADFKDAFKKCDIILTPATLGDMRFAADVAGLPRISAGNLYFYADKFKEEAILKAAYAFERAAKK